MDAYLKEARVWVLSDGKPGHENQSLGVCEALGVEPELKRLETRTFGKLLQWFYPVWRFKNLPTGPWPDMVVSTGYHVSVAAKWVKMKNPDTILVHMMKPKGFYGAFTVLAIPEHDRPKAARNVIATLGAPHRVSAEKLVAEKETWQKTLNPENKTCVAVMIGGNSKAYRFDEAAVERLTAQLDEKFGTDVRYVVTTSRRTGGRETQLLKDFFARKDAYIYTGEGDNPYFGMLSCADSIVVSAESVSMLSEACATSAPVYAFDLQKVQSTSKKLSRFYDGFLKVDRIGGLDGKVRTGTYDSRMEAAHVAAFVKSKVLQRFI